MNLDRNTIVAIVLAIAVLVSWEIFFQPKVAPKPKIDPVESTTPVAPPSAPQAVTTPAAVDAATPAERTGAPEKRIPISTPSLHGSLTLTGGRIDDITLAQY